jgi:hypothetical protein
MELVMNGFRHQRHFSLDLHLPHLQCTYNVVFYYSKSDWQKSQLGSTVDLVGGAWLMLIPEV